MLVNIIFWLLRSRDRFQGAQGVGGISGLTGLGVGQRSAASGVIYNHRLVCLLLAGWLNLRRLLLAGLSESFFNPGRRSLRVIGIEGV